MIGTKKASKKKLIGQKFVEMRNADKEKFILSLCIGKYVSEKVLNSSGRVMVEEIKYKVFNSNICLETVRHLFTEERWNRFYDNYNRKSDHLKFTCDFCTKTDKNGDNLIACGHCLHYFHFDCVKKSKKSRRSVRHGFVLHSKLRKNSTKNMARK